MWKIKTLRRRWRKKKRRRIYSDNKLRRNK